MRLWHYLMFPALPVLRMQGPATFSGPQDWNGSLSLPERPRRVELSVSRVSTRKYTTYSSAFVFSFKVNGESYDPVTGSLRLHCVANKHDPFTLTGNERTLTGTVVYRTLSGRVLQGQMSLKARLPQVVRERRYELRFARRKVKTDGTIEGDVFVNNKSLGTFFENVRHRIPAGAYRARLKYVSEHLFVQGPFGTLAHTGDFLINLVDVPKSQYNGGVGILLHAGNKASNSAGCILLGPATNTGSSAYLPGRKGEEGPLYQIRRQFYGTDLPVSTPDKLVFVVVEDIPDFNTPEKDAGIGLGAPPPP